MIDPALLDEANFRARAAAIDALEFQGAEGEASKRLLEDVDAALFRRLRAEIRNGAALRPLLDRYVPRSGPPDPSVRYDHLDTFVNGLLAWHPIPGDGEKGHPEMIRYQQTPSRFVLDLVDRSLVTAGDVFVDIGSGLGQVAMLVNLLTGAAARGIEADPMLCGYAARAARELNLTNVQFTNADAREAGYDAGTLFYLYTPFTGGILAAVMDRLRLQSRERTFKVVTYGPITAEFARADWAARRDSDAVLAAFQCGLSSPSPSSASR